MKLLMFIISLVNLSSLSANNIAKELVLGEIQSSLIKNHGANKNYWSGGKAKPVRSKSDLKINPIPNKKKTQEPVPVKRRNDPKRDHDIPPDQDRHSDNIVRAKRFKRGLIDDVKVDDKSLVKKSRKKYRYKKKKYIYKKNKKLAYKKSKKRAYKKNRKYSLKNGSIKRSGNSWADKKLREQGAWQKSSLSQLDKWEREKKAMLTKWQKDKKSYFKRLPGYKKNLLAASSFSSATPISRTQKNNKLKIKFRGQGAVVVPEAFHSEVKDQGKRPTCSAFASTRALEISLAQTGPVDRLSDQYLYFASKPHCQSSPCSKRGSWALNAFNQSLSARTPDIPTQKACPYSKSPRRNNETQIPLSGGCFQGVHKLKKYHKVKSLKDIVKALDNGSPVVSAFRLSPNFYRNKGVVFYKDAKGVASGKAHAAGHAILLIGYMKIPPHLNEGKLCFITANSWGVGWGIGGHACLSERWVNEFRFDIAFLAVDKVI